MSATVSPALPLDAALEQAIAEHQAGRYQQAEELYLGILEAQPFHAIANHNLGLLAGQLGQYQAGLPYLHKALSVNPDEGQFWLSYATGLLKAGQPAEALDIVSTAIARGLDNPASQALRLEAQQAADAAADAPSQQDIDEIVGLYHAGQYPQMENATRRLLEAYPESAFGWSVLGTALQVQGKDALQALQKTVALAPHDAEAHGNLGNAWQAAGQFDAAIDCYLRALEIQPDFAEAHSNLGGALLAQGRLQDAAESYRRALQVRPDYALAHFNLGNTLKELQQFDAAAGSYRSALLLLPDDAEIHCNLGNTLQAMQDYPAALDSYRRALELDPAYVAAHSNSGAALHQLKRHAEAEASYRHALRLAPRDANANNGLGQCLQALDRFDDAVQAYRSAIVWQSQHVAARSNLGQVLYLLERKEEAIASYREVLRLQPDSADAHSQLALALAGNEQPELAHPLYLRAVELAPDSAKALVNLGDFLKTSQRYDEAIASYRRALLIDAADAAVHHSIGLALQADNQFDAAIAAYTQALEIDPGLAIAHSNIGSAQQAQKLLEAARLSYMRALELEARFPAAHFNLGTCLSELGQPEAAIDSYLRALDIEPAYREAHVNLGAVLSNMGRIDDAIQRCRLALDINPGWEDVHSNLLFLLAHSAGQEPAALFAEHRRYAERFETPHIASWPAHPNPRDPQRQLRIGFISADFNNHAVAHFITPVLDNLVKSPDLSLYAYYNNQRNDHITARLRELMPQWRQIDKLSNQQAARQISDDGIDILIDLSGHTGGNRMTLLARKPAPLQASWIGYPLTTGLQAVDYYLTDRHFSPPGLLDEQFSEKLLSLPACAPFLPSHEAPTMSPAPALQNGYLTFGSFNRANKLSRAVIARWSTLLRAVPDARMFLAAMPSERISDTLRGWFAEEGVAAERLTFQLRTDNRTYLELHRHVDVCLDTFPYTGGTTSFHALWMGVPTLTVAGPTLPSRAGASILEHTGLEAFAARDEDDFVRKGKFVADNIMFLATLRLTMRQRLEASAMGQPALIAAGLESGLRSMWQRWCAGLPAAPFEALAGQETA
ncbi:tetratricopeptide repeat protein [Janthinobacterium agaricidamnosum]|nr:tetratricopeptide repeat protein [Janthinobacterium agaricidamnosum]